MLLKETTPRVVEHLIRDRVGKELKPIAKGRHVHLVPAALLLAGLGLRRLGVGLHLVDLFLGQAAGRFDPNLLLLAAAVDLRLEVADEVGVAGGLVDKEVDAGALAVVDNLKKVVEIFRYLLEGKL